MSVRRFRCDDETGEIVTYYINKETGEPCVDGSASALPVPLQTNQNIATPATSMKLPRGCGYGNKKLQSLKKNIVNGSNMVSYRMLLIPTVMIFPAFLCVLLMLLEIYLHVRCHKKNKLLKDSSLYYRSPFHQVTSTFCGVCRESDSAWKVGQLQDQRRNRYDYLRGIM